jgi:predicted nucleotidyltransferase
MENVRNKLPQNIKLFFNKLSRYLDTKLYFYGSVQRNDYFHGESDIDIDIFTNNTSSTNHKLCHFLKLNYKKIKRVYWKLNVNGEMAYGYKISYKNENLKIACEFSIYDEKYREGVLQEHNKKIVLPFYLSFFLIILKFLYYNLKILPRETYSYLKNKSMNLLMGFPDDKFVAL